MIDLHDLMVFEGQQIFLEKTLHHPRLLIWICAYLEHEIYGEKWTFQLSFFTFIFINIIREQLQFQFYLILFL